jgi:hypothetical protein
MFFLNKIGEQEGRTSCAQSVVEVVQIMYTHVCKCENGEIIFLKK